MAFLKWTPPNPVRSPWIRAHVGAVEDAYVKEGASAADVYTYGAASKALSEGQAAQAWNELKKQQNFPAVKQVASGHTCPPGFLFAPDLETCVNRDNVHVAMGDSAAGWWWNSALSSYLRLNEPKAWDSSQAAADASLRGLRALRMTSGSFGWSNVRSELRGVAQLLIHTSTPIRDQYDEDVDAFAFALEKSIAPYYDKDVQGGAEAKSAEAIDQLVRSQYGHSLSASGAASFGVLALVTGAVGLGLYAAVSPSGAASLVKSSASRLYQASAYAVRKARGIAP